jgi:hypothetical protein
VPAWTLRLTPFPDDALRAVEAVCVRRNAALRAEAAKFARQYAYIEADDTGLRDDLSSIAEVTVFDGPVIALAVSPTVAEALPGLLHALGGPGRPAGILDCARIDDTIIIEWDLDRTAWPTIETLIDVELRILRSGRVNALLSPLPVEWVARLAAYALRAPEITADRILEVQLERHGLRA